MSAKTFVYIEDKKQFGDLLTSFKKNGISRIAVDLEGEFNHRYYGMHLSLIQVSDGQNTYVVDAIKIDDFVLVRELLEEKNRTMLFYDAASDLVLLQNVAKVKAGPIWDLRVAADVLEIKNPMEHYGFLELDGTKSQFQRSDWMLRPLSGEQLAYAAADVEFHHVVMDCLIRDLKKTGKLAEFAQKNEIMQKKDRTLNPYVAYKKLLAKARLGEDQKEQLRLLWAAREKLAQEHNIPPTRIIHKMKLVSFVKNSRNISSGNLASGLTLGNRSAQFDTARFVNLYEIARLSGRKPIDHSIWSESNEISTLNPGSKNPSGSSGFK